MSINRNECGLWMSLYMLPLKANYSLPTSCINDKRLMVAKLEFVFQKTLITNLGFIERGGTDEAR